eukprot:841918-Prymnesium_polylepis.1
MSRSPRRKSCRPSLMSIPLGKAMAVGAAVKPVAAEMETAGVALVVAARVAEATMAAGTRAKEEAQTATDSKHESVPRLCSLSIELWVVCISRRDAAPRMDSPRLRDTRRMSSQLGRAMP